MTTKDSTLDAVFTLDTGNGYYDIELERVSTPLELLTWVDHLTHKRWVTPANLHQLIEWACKARGWKLPDA